MVKGTIGEPKIPFRLSQSESLSRMSGSMWHDTMVVFKAMIDAGGSSLMQAYASSVIIADFLHSAELLTDNAYTKVLILSDIIGGVGAFGGIIGSLLGNNALQPVLKSRVDQNTDQAGEPGDQTSGAINAANAAALSGLIQEATLALA